MITTPKMLGLLAVAFVAGSFIASPELRAYAAATIGSADIIDNSIQSIDIKDGQVKAADLAGSAVTSAKIAGNAVTSGKIADGTIAYGDVSRSLIAVEHRNDCNCGGTGWDPDGTSRFEFIYDDRITLNSLVAITGVDSGHLCSTYVRHTLPGAAIVVCDSSIQDGEGVNYTIFNNPAYG